MILTIHNEVPFQILSSSFSIGPSETGYELQVGADSRNFTTLFSVGANTPRMVTNVANGSYFRLKNNVGDVKVNWQRVCTDEGGGGASGTELSPVSEFPAGAEAGTVIAYSGSSSAAGIYQFDGTEWTEVGGSIDLSNYYTKAQTEEAISAATDDMKTYTDNRIDGYDSAVTLTQTIDAVNLRLAGSNVYEADEVGWEALGTPRLFTTNMQQYDLGHAPGDPNLGRPNYAKFNYVGETNSVGEFTGVYYALPANGEFIEGVPVQLTRTTEQPETVYTTPALTAGTGNYIWDNVNLTITWKRQPVIEQHVPGVATEQYVQDALSGVNMDNYYTSAQTEEAISAATSGKADAANVTPRSSGAWFPAWNEQGIITSITETAAMVATSINGVTFKPWVKGSNFTISPFYAPQSAGTAGDILVSAGANQAPVWTTDNKVSSSSVSTIWKGTQAEYDAITTKDPNTFYIIVSN